MCGLKIQVRQQFIAVLLLGLVVFVSTSPVYAKPDNTAVVGNPVDILTTATAKLIKIINQDREKIKQDPRHVQVIIENHLVPHIDFFAASKWVLGKHQRKASKAQIKEFYKQFRTLMIRFYATALREYLIDTNKTLTMKMVKFYPVKLSNEQKDVIVRSEVGSSAGKKVPVHYHMHIKRGKWKIYDVSVDGISIVSTYRTSFSTQIRKQGLEQLITALKARNASLSENMNVLDK